MAGSNRYLQLTTVAVVLGLIINIPTQLHAQPTISSLSITLPNQWEAKFQPPQRRGNPAGREGGATRGPKCLLNDKQMIALVPPSGFGLTASNYPKIFWYQPPTNARLMKFVLLNEAEEELYSKEFAITGKEGIMSLEIPSSAGLLPLKVNQQYHWELTLVCNPNPDESSGNIVAGGSFQRVEKNQLLNRTSTTPAANRINIYAEAGLWYETLETLINLRRQYPNDPALFNTWVRLLNSIGLGQIANQRQV